MRILLLDDDKGISRTLGHLVRYTTGDEVVTVTNAEAARLEVERGVFGVIVADFLLPGDESGLDFLEWMASVSPNTRRILITGLSRRDVERRGSLERVDTLLLKPFSLESLIEVLRESGG